METLILLGVAYLGLMVVILSVLVMARRGDEAAHWQADHAGDEERRRRGAA